MSTSGAAPLEVQFTDASTPAGAADAWEWDFGDGGNSAAQHPVYTYTTAGAYTVTLTVTDTGTGETDGLAQTGYITVTESATLTADFSATPTSGDAPLEVQFTDESTPGGMADQWQWEFGDGGTSTAQHPVYTYTTAGVYTVTLTVTDTDTAETDTLIRTSYIQVESPLQTTVITYEYDDLYRLTGAAYTGAISATYAYAYDSVGNMTAFTETVTSTRRVERTFDGANQLITSFNVDAGTTSYTYDGNGNLTVVYPPGSDAQNPAGALQYDYDQRNMLITHTTYVSGTGWVLQAAYVYDGANDRLQQVDHTGGSPVTTTYTNDVVGLTQVLVADDGASQVYNLFGLDLISQDGGSEVRTLLGDALGSVRLELAGGAVEAVTTYSPYGEVLAQSGTSGTVYGFTGEQKDGATGLLYLRARYFNTAVKVFQSHDSWRGRVQQPLSYNGYLYVFGNPVNRVDPNGMCPGCSTPPPPPTEGTPTPPPVGTPTPLAMSNPRLNQCAQSLDPRLHLLAFRCHSHANQVFLGMQRVSRWLAHLEPALASVKK